MPQSDDLLTGGLSGGSPSSILTGGLVSSGSAPSTAYAPGELDFSFVVDPDCLVLFADGGQPYAVTVTAIHNADSVILDSATIAASLSVFLSFSPPPLQSSAFTWKAAAWLYGATAGKVIVGAAAGGDALPVGAYYAVIRIVNTSGVILLEQVLGTVNVR